MKVMSSVSTAFKVHYNKKIGRPIRPSWRDAPWPLGDRRPRVDGRIFWENLHKAWC